MTSKARIQSGHSATVDWVCLPGSVDLLALHRADPERYPHLLESAARGEQGCFDILFAFPDEALRLSADRQLIPGREAGNDFLAALDDLWTREAIPEADVPFPFHGGWFLYLGYELAAQVEPTVTFPRPAGALPTALAIRCSAAVIRDHRNDCLWLVAERTSAQLLDTLRQDVEGLNGAEAMNAGLSRLGTFVEEPSDTYLAAVRRALDYIRDGDIFQANLSRRWDCRLEVPTTHAELYSRLRARNPGPFNGLATFGDSAIISSSPERLVAVRNGMVDTRPIAGTRPRGAGAAQDAALSNELLAHPKERAEHVMLIDLERNDIGRVCRPGSVEVNELMVLESYAHVHHIVSNVRGALRAGATPGEVIRAVFPGGTITGCPKVRCMEIIAELEEEGRGAYTGAMGYLNRDGSLDLNILIRTLVREGEQLRFRAGAGIVFDSVPEQELAETRAKARGLVLALQGDES